MTLSDKTLDELLRDFLRENQGHTLASVQAAVTTIANRQLEHEKADEARHAELLQSIDRVRARARERASLLSARVDALERGGPPPPSSPRAAMVSSSDESGSHDVTALELKIAEREAAQHREAAQWSRRTALQTIITIAVSVAIGAGSLITGLLLKK